MGRFVQLHYLRKRRWLGGRAITARGTPQGLISQSSKVQLPTIFLSCSWALTRLSRTFYVVSILLIFCCYFDAKCCQRSLKRFEKVLHKKNKSKSSKLYSMFAILQCHALKVLWWSHSLKNFMPPLLLESWFKTEAGGGICSDVVRVSPIWHYRTLFGNNSIKGWNWTQTAGQLCRHNK